MLELEKITQKALHRIPLTREEAMQVLSLPDTAAPELVQLVFPIRKKFKGMRVGIQLLSNAKSGNCSQNCAYCAQSAASTAPIEKYPLMPLRKLLENGTIVQKHHLARHCIGLSGMHFSDAQIEQLAERIRLLKAQTGETQICCSIGFLTPTQARMLKEAGVNRINHNLNTGRKNYPNICTTHTYDQRVANIKMLQKLGFEICCGGIFGMGETKDDILDMLFDLRALSPQAVPINFLLPIEGTRLAQADTSHLTPDYCLKLLCLTRLMLPECDIRCAAGREVYLKGREYELFCIVDSIFASGYLTTGGQAVTDTEKLVQNAGFISFVESEDEHSAPDKTGKPFD